MADSQPTEENSKRSIWNYLGELDLLPLRKTAKGYNLSMVAADSRAALNVALLAFPQGIAYAAIAGLPISYGIYGSAIASIVGMFFAGSKFIVLGPTNATSVAVGITFLGLGLSQNPPPATIALLIFLVGLVLVIGAYIRLASLIQYVSRTVITGYITAAAMLIIMNQVRKALGFSFAPDESGKTFVNALYYTAKHIGDTQWPALLLSIVTAALFILLNKFFKKLPNVAITLLLSTLFAYVAHKFIQDFEVTLLQGMNAKDWGLTLPTLHLDTINLLMPDAIAIAILCVLEGNSIGKSLAAREGARIDSNQEMLSVGMANIACGLFSGMAASGSLTRSQLNTNSGAITPLSSLYSGLIVVAGAFTLGQYIRFIPVTTLAVVVVSIGISLINKYQLKLVTKTTASDRITFFVTLIVGLTSSLSNAIYVGTACSIALFIKKVASPEIVEYKFNDEGQLDELKDIDQRNDPEVSIVHVEGELFFGAAELFRDQMRRVSDDPNLKVVVIKLRNAHNVDATSCMALEELIKYMNEADRELLVSEVRPDTMQIFKNSGLIHIIGEINLFPDEAANPTLSTAKALKRAKEIIGDREAKVSIYAKEKRK